MGICNALMLVAKLVKTRYILLGRNATHLLLFIWQISESEDSGIPLL